MTIDQIITIVSNRISTLNSMRATAVNLGQIDSINKIDEELAETQQTLDALKEVA